MSRHSDIAYVYAAESRHRLKPHLQRRHRPHKLPVQLRTQDSLTVRLGEIVPRETLDALYALASPSALIH